MVKKITSILIRQLFFDFPSRRFGIREISRFVNVSHPSVMKYIAVLEKEGIIRKVDSGFSASGSKQYKLMKKLALIEEMARIDLIKYIEEECMPNVIVLFGSASRGEDDEESDIDLFVESKEKELDLRTFEKKIKRKINVTFGVMQKLNKDFLESVINGIILFGGIRI